MGSGLPLPSMATRLGGAVRENTQSSYYRARYYNQSAGRFISEDPLKFRESTNFYAYVRNNPIRLSDPRGLWAGGVGGVVAWIIGVPRVAGGGEGSCALVFDGQGNIGTLSCFAWGEGTVVPAGGSLSPQGAILACPNCKTICDIAVQGFAAGGGGYAGGASVSLSMKTATISISGGPAGGVGGADSYSVGVANWCSAEKAARVVLKRRSKLCRL
jgi:RHS repeat-associated protein